MITSGMLLLRSILLGLCEFYSVLIIIYVLMSWLPNTGYGLVGDIYRILGKICDPYLNLFRRIIPPIGGMIDISPIFAIIVVQLVSGLIAMLI